MKFIPTSKRVRVNIDGAVYTVKMKRVGKRGAFWGWVKFKEERLKWSSYNLFRQWVHQNGYSLNKDFFKLYRNGRKVAL